MTPSLLVALHLELFAFKSQTTVCVRRVPTAQVGAALNAVTLIDGTQHVQLVLPVSFLHRQLDSLRFE